MCLVLTEVLKLVLAIHDSELLAQCCSLTVNVFIVHFHCV